jgi:hypothetical protein
MRSACRGSLSPSWAALGDRPYRLGVRVAPTELALVASCVLLMRSPKFPQFLIPLSAECQQHHQATACRIMKMARGSKQVSPG